MNVACANVYLFISMLIMYEYIHRITLNYVTRETSASVLEMKHSSRILNHELQLYPGELILASGGNFNNKTIEHLRRHQINIHQSCALLFAIGVATDYFSPSRERYRRIRLRSVCAIVSYQIKVNWLCSGTSAPGTM